MFRIYTKIKLNKYSQKEERAKRMKQKRRLVSPQQRPSIYDLYKVQLTVEYIIVQYRKCIVNGHQLNVSPSLNDNLQDKEFFKFF